MGNWRVLLQFFRSNFRPKDEFANLWNSETRFDVGGANEYSTWEQTAIFDYFLNSEYKLYYGKPSTWYNAQRI